jgi:hypothetical protein
LLTVELFEYSTTVTEQKRSNQSKLICIFLNFVQFPKTTSIDALRISVAGTDDYINYR